MNPSSANRLNAIVLLLMGAWGLAETHFGPGITSPTVFIAPVAGLLFLLLGGAFTKGNKAIIHVIVLLTLLLALMFIGIPLRKALAAGNTMTTIRVMTMTLSGIIATIVFIKSFIDARKAA